MASQAGKLSNAPLLQTTAGEVEMHVASFTVSDHCPSERCCQVAGQQFQECCMK